MMVHPESVARRLACPFMSGGGGKRLDGTLVPQFCLGHDCMLWVTVIRQRQDGAPSFAPIEPYTPMEQHGYCGMVRR